MTESMRESMSEGNWAEFIKLVELVRAHKVKNLETKIDNFKVRIYWHGRTTHIELMEATHA